MLKKHTDSNSKAKSTAGSGRKVQRTHSKLTQKLLYVALLLVLATGCGKDDDDDKMNNSDPLRGTWILVSENFSNCNDASNNGSESCTSSCFEFTFNSDGKTSNSEGGAGTYKLNGNKVELCDDDGCFTADFSISGNRMTFNFPKYKGGCTFTGTYTKK